MAPKRKPGEKSLGAFGYTKKVFHRGKFTQVEIPEEPKEEFKLKSNTVLNVSKTHKGLEFT